MPRKSGSLRGRRVAWLLASALPLLATENDEVVPSVLSELEHHHDIRTTSDLRRLPQPPDQVPTPAIDSSGSVDNDSSTEKSDFNLPLHNLRIPRFSLDWATQTVHTPNLSPKLDDEAFSSSTLQQLPWEKHELEWCDASLSRESFYNA